jgi:hypothetical protein
VRILLKVNIPVDTGNTAVTNNTLPQTIESILSDLKPEAAYFTDDKGMRTAFVICDMQDASQIPAIAEPWFLAFNAHVEFHPVMNVEDLRRASPGIERAVRNYRGLKKAA